MTEPTARRDQEDAYTTSFGAHVLSRGRWRDRPAVRLTETWFYPEGGGQLADQGTIGGLPVEDVQTDEVGVVWHVMADTPQPGPAPARIDWSRRFDHMQLHTGQHVLSAAFERELDAPTLSSTLGAERGVLEVGLDRADWRLLERVEQAANRVLWEDRALVHHWTDAAGAAKFPLRKAPQVSGRIRIIEIPDWDWSACGGTHTRRTGEVGVIKVTGWERVRGHIRFSFLCGRRALEDHAWRTESLSESARRHTLRDRDLIAHLERSAEERDALRKRVAELERSAMAAEVRQRVGEPPVGVEALREARSGADVRQFALLAIEEGAPWAVSGALSPEPALVVAIASRPGADLRVWLPDLLAAARGKGGGSPLLLTLAPADAASARAAHALAVERLTLSGPPAG